MISHYTFPPRKSDKLRLKEPTYGWTQSFFMKGFSISQLKNDHQSGGSRENLLLAKISTLNPTQKKSLLQLFVDVLALGNEWKCLVQDSEVFMCEASLL